MKEIGISIYPEFNDVSSIKEQINIAKELGYTVVFTSLQLGDLGFENTSVGITKEFEFLFDYCYQMGLRLHVDINDRMLEYVKASPDNLKPIHDLHIQVLRLDGGFTHQEVARMTKNPYGIIIEENASMLHFSQERIETIRQEGNTKQYWACHNFFPLNETGLTYEDALQASRLFKKYDIKVGIFIGSLHSPSTLNAVGNGVLTIEDQRYKPAHIQVMELFVHPEYDYVIFGDSHPTYEEKKRVSEVAKNNEITCLKNTYTFDYLEHEIPKDMYCIEIPVWLNNGLDEKIKEEILKTVFWARADQPAQMIRATQTRDICSSPRGLAIERTKYSVVLINDEANRYRGELQIPLQDQPAVHYANVIGQVKPYGHRLVELTKYANVMFVLKEE